MARRPSLSLHPERCDGCGRCVGACREHAIRPGTNYIMVDWERCDGCGKCVDLCDAGALELRGAAATSRGARSTASVEPALAPHPSAGAFTGPWSLGEVAAVLAGIGLLFALRQWVMGSTWMTHTVPLTAKPIVRAGVLSLYYALQLALLAALGYRKDVGFSDAFGLKRTAIGAAVLWVVGMTLAARLFASAYGIVVALLGWRMPEGPVSDLTLYFGRDTVGLALSVAMVVIVGPFFEEVVFRGVLMNALIPRVGSGAAIAVSALLFGAYHFNSWLFLPTAAMGAAAGWVAVKCRSSWPAYALHAAYNAIAVFATFYLVANGRF